MLGLGSGRAELPELGVVRPHMGMGPSGHWQPPPCCPGLLWPDTKGPFLAPSHFLPEVTV